MPLEDVDFGDIHTYARAGDAQVLGSLGTIETVAENNRATAWSAAGSALGIVIEGETEALLPTTSDPHLILATLVNATQTADAVAAPDGTTTATQLIEDTTVTAAHYVFGTFTSSPAINAGSNRCWSFFVKANGRTRFAAIMYDSGAQSNYVQTVINLTAGTATGSAGGNGVLVLALDPEAYPNGWYRITLIGTPNPSSTNALRPRVQLYSDAGSVNYTGDGASGVYLWGHNIHTGLSLRSFIATTSAPKTRGADLVALTNLSSTFSATQGTFYAKFKVPHAAPAGITRTIIYAWDGTTDNSYDIRIDAASLMVTAVVRSGASQVASISGGAVTAGSFANVAFSYTADAFRISVNGATAVSDTAGAVPTGINAVFLGRSNASGANPLDGVIQKFERRIAAMNATDLAVFSAT